MFFKELCMFAYCLVINVHHRRLSVVRDSFYMLSCVTFFVNNFFQLFSTRFRSFKEGP